MLVFLVVVALTSVNAQFNNSTLPKCYTVGPLAPTNVYYGNACNDQFTNSDLGCKPSADCGYKYCCLNKTSTPSGDSLCSNPAGAGSCAIPQVNSFYTACATGTNGISSYGCPCASNPTSCLPGWQCSVPPTTFSFAGTFPASSALGYSGTGQYTVLPYNEQVCWTYPLSYNASNSSNYLTPFGGCTTTGCGYAYTPQLPVFGVCSNTIDCQVGTNVTSWVVPTSVTSSNPYRCDIHGTSMCQNKASCDPVNHICQSRQFNDSPGNPAHPYIANSQIWFFNGGCSTC